MMDSLDLQAVAQRTGIPIRRLRYVLEHGVLPGADQHSLGHRVTRRFTLFEAFGIALAARMLGGGVRRDLTAQVVALLCHGDRGARPSDIPLFRAFAAMGPAHVEIADGVFVRLHIEGVHRPWDSGWLDLATGAKIRNVPISSLTVSLSLAELRDCLRK